MELREIATFLQVAQLKSFSKAARQLGYSQAAVTIQIKQMEKELNVHLFDRIGKQTTLTHQGTVFYEYAAALMRDFERAKDAVADPGELTGTLCLGVIESVCSSLLPSLLTTYHRMHPKVNISIVTDSPEALLDMMNSNLIDLVYFLDRRMYDTKWTKVMEEPENIVFVASPDHPAAKKSAVAPLTLDEIIRQPLILTEKNASYRSSLDQYLAALNKDMKPFLESGNTEFLIKLLRQGLGISFLPEFTVHEDVNSGRLSVLDVSDFHLRIWRQLVYRKDKWVTREMQEFCRLALES